MVTLILLQAFALWFDIAVVGVDADEKTVGNDEFKTFESKVFGFEFPQLRS